MTTTMRSCTVCGHVNPALATYCMTCGEPLVVDAARSRNLTGLLLQDQLLKQRYRILAQIGQGGFAAVYKAVDLHFGQRLVAIKEMSQSGLNPKEQAEAVDAFKREAYMLAGLQHPNLPHIYDHFSEGGRWYLVMEFIEGQTLEDSLLQQTDGRLSLKETLTIGLQLCSVLDYLHTRHPPIIFRDLKPANILRVPSGHLYLIDFGIARLFKPGQSRDTIAFGSPGYAAPEQYGKAQTTQQSDIYSLGVLLHSLLSGEDPSERPFLFSPLRLYGPDELAELERLIERMTALAPEQRPPNVAAVQAQLQALATRSQTLRSPVVFQTQRPPHGETGAPERAAERERSGSEAGQEQVQEQEILPPAGRSRRRLIIGGLLAGATLAIGGGGLLALFPKRHGLIVVSPAIGTTGYPTDVMFGFNAQHTRFNASESILSRANVSRLTGAWISQPIGRNYFSSPAVSGGLLYVGTYDGRVCAIDVATSQIRWASAQYSSSQSVNSSTPAVVKGVVYICLQDRRLYAFDAASGHLRWVAPGDIPVYTSPTVVDGIVYITSNQNVYAFDAATGQQRWISSSAGFTSSSPAVANGLVYVDTSGSGAGTGRLSAFDVKTGQRRWVSDLVGGGIDGNASPVVANGLVYIGVDVGLVAFDALTGKKRWVAPLTKGTTGSSVAVAYGTVYFSAGRIYAIDAATGDVHWASDDIGASNGNSPLVANGVIYVSGMTTTNSWVYALDATTGRMLWRSPAMAGQTFTTPAIANGMVYVASGEGDGRVYAFRLPHT